MMDRGDGSDARMEVSYQEPRTLVEYQPPRSSPPSVLILNPVVSSHTHYRSNLQVHFPSAMWGTLIWAGGSAASPD